VHSRVAGERQRGCCQLVTDCTIDEILEDYPYLERDDIFAALEYAAAAVTELELPTPAA
jgi:hypothetical protein